MTDLDHTSDPAAPEGAKPGLTSIGDLRSQATQAAETARTSVNALASEARDRVREIVDSRKQAGAEQLSGFARAAHNAAGELERSSPTVARLVHDAASSVDHLSGNLRSSDIRDVVSSVTSFARQQPVAFFAGSVLAGFVLARFLKSDAAARPATAGTSSAGSAPGEGFKAWSATHPDDPAL